MKNKLKIGIAVFFIIIFGYYIKSNAAISAQSKQVNSGEQFSINVTSDISLSAYSVKAQSYNGLEFVGSSGGTGSGTTTISNALAQGGTTNLATFTFKAPSVEKDTQYTIRFSAEGMGDENLSSVPDSDKNVTITVKAPENNNSNSNNGNSGNNGNSSSEPATKSTEAILRTLGIKPNDFTGFRKNQKEYSVEVPNSTSEVEVYAEALKGEIISGIGKVSLKEGETTTVNVVVKAEAGNTETYTLKIKRRTAEEEAQSASDATLKNLGINPKEYDFSGFKKDQTEYSVEVPNEIKTVEIYAEATDSKAQVTGTGEIELNEGANEAKVEVVAQDGTKKTYTITITRKASEVATTSLENTKFGLSDLTIAGQTISPAFKNDVYSYTVGVKEDLASLDIKATATDSDAKIEIVGNENLQQGENTITVIVKNEKTNQTATYQITVNKNVVSEAKQRSFFNPSTWGKEMIIKSIIVAVLVLLIIIAVVLKVKISKEAKMENGQDNDENIGFPGADELDKAIAEHQELTENNGENKENKTKNYVENDAKTEEKMKEIDVEKNDANASGRRKGKHF